MNIKQIIMVGVVGIVVGAAALDKVEVTAVEAQQRYPWNGLVDIVVTIQGSADDVDKAGCSFAATDSATGASVPVASITRKGVDTGSGTTWTRRFVWDAANDVGAVKIDDVALTVDAKVLGGVQLWENGPYWAECNVGASKPEEYGYYFWWGDTVGYKREGGTWTDDWYYSDVTWVSSTGVRMASSPFNYTTCPTRNKSNAQLQSVGYINVNLVAAYDAATARLGAPWRMPTDVEFSALISNCDTTWMTRGGICGRLVRGRGAYASKSIFLPAAGYGEGSRLTTDGGGYWSSTPYSVYRNSAWSTCFGLSYFDRYDDVHRRSDGLSVRPVRGFSVSAMNITSASVTAHLKLDCQTGVRTPSPDGELLHYDASWYENGEEVRITENGLVITTGTAGFHTWHPASSCSTNHELTLEVLSGRQVVDTETAEFGREATLAHSEVITTAARAATCTEDGCTKGSYCSRCGEVLATSQAIPALGHVEVVTVVARAETCTEDGCTKGSCCNRCGAVLVPSQTIQAGHIEVMTTAARAATCSEAGCTKGSYCSRCGKVLTTSQVIPALGHIEVVTVAEREPMFESDGCTRELYCSRCHAILSESEVVPALSRCKYDDLPESIRSEMAYDEDGFLIWNGWVFGYQHRGATEVVVPEGIVGIGRDVFADMYDLADILLPSTLRYIASGAFHDCSFLDDVVIPDGVEEIGEGAFEDCSWMQTITFGKGLKRVGKDAFKGCSQLQKVVFQDGLEEIGEGAFDGCWRMQSVALPLSVTHVGTTAFTGCSSLAGVTTPTHGGTMAEWFAPVCGQIKDVTVPAGEWMVADEMFAGCSSLEHVAFKDLKDENGIVTNGVFAIGDAAFRNCVKLEQITLPEALGEIGGSAFAGCSALKSMALPDSVTAIGVESFANCSALADLTLSRLLTTIPDRTFQSCWALDSFTVPESVTHLGSRIVSGTSDRWSDNGTRAIYFLGHAPSHAADVYAGTRSDLVSYIVYGTRGWDGRTSSRDIPQHWPTDVTDYRGILTWSPNPFDVTFDATGGRFEGDGSATYACQQITYTAYALPPFNPVRAGCIFDGWWTEYAGGTQVTPSTRVTLTKAHTLYAHWIVGGEVRVRFNATGGTVLPEYDNYTTGEPFGPLPVPTREYWDFDGWWTQTAGGSRITEASEVPAADVELFARWVPATYNIIFHSENGAYYADTRTQTFQYGDTVTLWENYWTCGSASFGGWALEPGGKAVYADRKVLTDLSAIRNGELHLYAVWIGDTYAVRFDSNGGTGYMPNQTMVVGVTYNLRTNCFVRSGYAFQGWSQSAGGMRKYSDGERIYSGFSSAKQGSTIVLYAVWKTIGSCTITFNAQGGTCSESQRTVLECSVIGELPTPERSGFAFRFWADGPNGGSILSEDTRIYSSRTYYAIWERAPDPIFTVSFDAQGGSVREQSRTIRSSAPLGALPTPTRSKYKFDGWYTAATGGTKVTASTKVTADVTYYAHWTYDGSATVSVNVGSGCIGMGTVSGGKTAKAGAKVSLTATAKSGYVFAGWYRDAEFYNRVEGDVDYRTPTYSYVVGEDDAEFYARFIPADEDYVDVSVSICSEFDPGVPIDTEMISINVTSESLPTVKVTGLPTGLKFTAKALDIKETKTTPAAHYEANTIYGTPTKSGVYAVTVTVTTAGKKTATNTFKIIVRKEGESLVDAECESAKGKVTGAGVCAAGQTLTLKATANKGYVFAGWYCDADVSYLGDEDCPWEFYDPVIDSADYRNPSLTVLGDGTNLTYYARFVRTDEDLGIVASVDDEYDLNGPWEMKLDIESLSLPSVTVKGLPAGLKFDAKTLTISGTPTKPGTYAVTLSLKNVTVKAAKTQTFVLNVANVESPHLTGVSYKKDAYVYRGGVAVGWDIGACAQDGYSISAIAGLPAGLKFNAKTGMVEGVPTKAGTFTATITLKNGKDTSPATITMNVEAIDPWAYGTFNGGSDNGQVQLAITSAGKLTGKYVANGITYTLAATAYSAYGGGTYSADVTVSWSYKEGSQTVKGSEVWRMFVRKGAVGGVITSDRFDAWQDVWSQSVWKAYGSELFGKSGTVKVLTESDYGLQEGESVALTIKPNGTVATKGVFKMDKTDAKGNPVFYTAAGSAVVCVTADEPFKGLVFVCFAPNAAKGFGGYNRKLVVRRANGEVSLWNECEDTGSLRKISKHKDSEGWEDWYWEGAVTVRRGEAHTFWAKELTANTAITDMEVCCDYTYKEDGETYEDSVYASESCERENSSGGFDKYVLLTAEDWAWVPESKSSLKFTVRVSGWEPETTADATFMFGHSEGDHDYPGDPEPVIVIPDGVKDNPIAFTFFEKNTVQDPGSATWVKPIGWEESGMVDGNVYLDTSSLVAGRKYVFGFEGLSATATVKMTLKTGGENLFTAETASTLIAGCEGACWAVVVPSSGVYAIVINDDDRDIVCRFGADAWDHKDDAMSGATKLNPRSDGVESVRTLWADDEADWFSFVATTDTYYKFVLVEKFGTPEVRVYDDRGEECAYTLLADPAKSVMIAATTKSTYYVKVARAAGAMKTDDPYTLVVTSVNPGTVKFAKTAVTVEDSAGYVDLSVSCTGSGGMTRVTYKTVGEQSSAENALYYPASGTLEWANGDKSAKTIRVRVVPQNYGQGGTFQVKLAPVDSASEEFNPERDLPAAIDPMVGDTATVTVTSSAKAVPGTIQLADCTDPEKPVVDVTATNDYMTLRFARVGGTDGMVAVKIETVDKTAKQGTDYKQTSDTYYWQDGDASTCEFPILLRSSSDNVATKTFTVKLMAVRGKNLSEATLAASTITVNIANDRFATTVAAYAKTLPKTSGIAINELETGTWFVGKDGSIYSSAPSGTLTFTLTGPGVFKYTLEGEEEAQLVVPYGEKKNNTVVIDASDKLLWYTWEPFPENLETLHQCVKYVRETTGEKVAAGKLPDGLKLAQDMVTRKWSISGTPTKAGYFYVKLTDAKGKEVQAINYEVVAAGTAIGTFDGLATTFDTDDGLRSLAQIQLTATAQGRLAAKVMVGGKTMTFADTGYASFDDSGDYPSVTAKMNQIIKVGAETVTNWLVCTVIDTPESDAVARLVEGRVQLQFAKLATTVLGLYTDDVRYKGKICRDNSKLTDWKTEVEAFAGYYTVTLANPGARQGEPKGNGYLTLTVDEEGKTKIAGILADGTAYSGSSLATCLVRRDAGKALRFPLYACKSPYVFGGWLELKAQKDAAAPIVSSEPLDTVLVWKNDDAASTYDGEHGFSLNLYPVGGWYDTVTNLQKWFLEYDFSVDLPSWDDDFESLLPSGYETYAFAANPCGQAVDVYGDTVSVVHQTLVKDSLTKLCDFESSVNASNVKFTFKRATGILSGTFDLWYEGTNAKTGKFEQNSWMGLKHNGVLLLSRGDDGWLEDDVWTSGFYLAPQVVWPRKWTGSYRFDVKAMGGVRDWHEDDH